MGGTEGFWSRERTGRGRGGGERDRRQNKHAGGTERAAVRLFPALSAGGRLVIGSAPVFPNVPVGGDAAGRPETTRVGVLVPGAWT